MPVCLSHSLRLGPLTRVPSSACSAFFVYTRPHVSDFLELVLSHFVVGVWSSAQQHNLQAGRCLCPPCRTGVLHRPASRGVGPPAACSAQGPARLHPQALVHHVFGARAACLAFIWGQDRCSCVPRPRYPAYPAVPPRMLHCETRGLGETWRPRRSGRRAQAFGVDGQRATREAYIH